jgi:hypothetical protein
VCAGLPQNMQGESGHPVASASLSRSGPGRGSMWGTRRLNDMDPTPRLLHLGRRCDGMPAQLVSSDAVVSAAATCARHRC